MLLSLDISLLMNLFPYILIIENKSTNIAIEVHFTLQTLARD